MIKPTLSLANSLRLTASVVFAAAVIVTFAAYYNQDQSGIAPGHLNKEEPTSTSQEHNNQPGTNTANRRNLTLDTELILRAAEAIRLALNLQRRQKCSEVAPYRAVDDIKYARHEIVVQGVDHYSMEIVFDRISAVFVLVERTRNATAERFVLKSSTPSPCELDLSEQLAVSMTGWFSLTDGNDLAAVDP